MKKVEKIGEWKVRDGWVFQKRIYGDGESIESYAWRKKSDWWVFISHYEDWKIKIGSIVIYAPHGQAINYRIEDITFLGLKRKAIEIVRRAQKEMSREWKGE